MERINDAVRLCGHIDGRPCFSHAARDGAYYVFPLAVRRLSGTEDVINVTLRESDLEKSAFYDTIIARRKLQVLRDKSRMCRPRFGRCGRT